MEKIIIVSVEPKFGKPNQEGICTPFWACALGDGRKATIWDEGLGKTAMSNIGKELSVEIKTSPQGYSNIRSINIATDVNPFVDDTGDKPMALGMNDTQMPAQKNNVSLRDDKITAAVLFKGAVEMTKKHEFSNLQDEAKYMCECVVELNGVYKVALDLLNE